MSRKKIPLPFISLYIMYAVGFIVVGYALVRGYEYYLTPYGLRPHHDDYRLLRPAVKAGLWFGIVGSAMMVLLLAYSVRKRTKLLRFGRLKTWLNVHIFLGIMGPMLITLHTSFKFNGLVAVSFWAMVAVALSGVFGRYLYVQIPRNVRGEALSLIEMEKLVHTKLEPVYARMSKEAVDDIVKQAAGGDPPTHKLKFIFWLIGSDLVRALGRKRVDAILRQQGFEKQERTELLKATRSYALLKRRVSTLKSVERLFHYWHVFHRPFAAVMYIIMFIHIGIAFAFGIRWR